MPSPLFPQFFLFINQKERGRKTAKEKHKGLQELTEDLFPFFCTHFCDNLQLFEGHILQTDGMVTILPDLTYKVRTEDALAEYRKRNSAI